MVLVRVREGSVRVGVRGGRIRDWVMVSEIRDGGKLRVGLSINCRAL